MAMGRAEEPRETRWEVAARLVMALGEELTLEGIEEHTLDQLLAALEADAGALHVLEATGTALQLLVQRGLAPALAQELSHLPLDRPCLVARAAATQKLQVAANLTEAPAEEEVSSEPARPPDIYCWAAVPLQARGQLIGVLSLARRRPYPFEQSEAAIVQFIAHGLALSLLNARAFEAERRMRTALQAVDEATLAIVAEIEPHRVLQEIVDRAREVAGARYAALGIGTDPTKQFDPWVFSGLDEETARAIGHFPRPVGLLGAVPAEGKVIRVRDLASDPRFKGWPAHHPQMRSFLGIPIRAAGESIGNLYLADKMGPAEFSEEDERAVASLAAHAAVAYRHAQLYEQAQAQRNRLQTVVESSPLGIVFVEGASGYTFANSAAEELFGHEIVPATGRAQYLARFRRPDGSPLVEDELPSSRALRGETVIGTELVLVRPDDSEVAVLANAAPIRDAWGKVTGAVVLWQDITPLKLEQLREEFISLVAHELRTPITVIAGYADLLSRGQQGEMERRATESIRVSARRLERLVQDLLDASRIEARRLQLEPRPLEVVALVQDVVGRLQEVLIGHEVHVEVEGNPPPITADPGRIEQVLTNLLTNAAKYSPPESEIRVAVAERPGEVVVAVSNEGPGIPPEELPRLFTRFYRTRTARRGKAQGIGLGLYIARGLIEAHGGRIWATSVPGHGATFSFALPVRPAGGEIPAL